MKLDGFTPLGDRVLVRPNKGETRTDTGLIVIGNAGAPAFGDVIAVSPERDEHGRARVPFDQNCVIAYPRGTGRELSINGETLLVLHAGDVLGVVTPAKE